MPSAEHAMELPELPHPVRRRLPHHEAFVRTGRRYGVTWKRDRVECGLKRGVDLVELYAHGGLACGNAVDRRAPLRRVDPGSAIQRLVVLHDLAELVHQRAGVRVERRVGGKE